MYDLDSDEERLFHEWSKKVAEKKAIYETYHENLKRAIRELELFYFPAFNKRMSISSLKETFLKARKNDYTNKNLTHDINISDEDFTIALKHWDLKSVIKSEKEYFKCRLNKDVEDVLEQNENLFIFTDDTHKYNNINIIKCEICNLSFDKNIGCKKINTKLHQYREWIINNNLTISFYQWEKDHWKK